MKVHPIQTAFNGGKFSRLMDGHIDAPRRASSYDDSLNMLPLVQGPVTRRGGSKYIWNVKDSVSPPWLMPFEYNTEQAYMIEIGDQYMRFFKDYGIITESGFTISSITQAAPTVVTTSSAHGYSNGDKVVITNAAGMTQINGREFTVANVTSTTFELSGIDSSGYDAYTTSGEVAKIYEISTPYVYADLFDSKGLFQIDYTQSADVSYYAHGDYKTRVLSRTSHTSWALNEITFVDGPYMTPNETTTTLTPSGTSGSITLTASAVTGINNDTGFQSTDVGRHIRLKMGGNWYYGVIEGVTSTTVCTFGIKIKNLPSTTATADWRLGLYSDTTGWPKVAGQYGGRVILGASDGNKQRLDMTVIGGFSDTELIFSPTDLGAVDVNPDNAISITVSTTNDILWVAEDERGVVVGTAGGEFMIRSSDNTEALTPENAEAKRTSKKRCSKLRPIETSGAILFAQRSRRKIFEHAYSLEADGFRSNDMTVFCDDILENGVVSMAFAAEPYSVVWVATQDGGLRSFTYERAEDVIGWAPHTLGGVADINDNPAQTRCVAVIPASDDSRDDPWVIVKRYINSSTVYCIEYLTPSFDDVTMEREDAFHVDCGLTYDGSATATITGLWHLEGETVKAMVDGKSHPDLTVADGEVTLLNSVTGSKIHVGYGSEWNMLTHRPEAGTRDGTAQGRIKRPSHATIRVKDTLGLCYGENGRDEYSFDNLENFDSASELYTGDIKVPWPDGYSTDGRLYLCHDGVFPATIQMIAPRMRTSDN